MKDRFGLRERRNLDRVKMNYPATYTRYDKWGNPYDQKIAKVVEVSLKGVKLQSSFPVDSEEILGIILALSESLVTLLGKVVYVNRSKDEGFEFGVSTKKD